MDTSAAADEQDSGKIGESFVNTEQLPHVILRGADSDLGALRSKDAQVPYLNARQSLLSNGIPCSAVGLAVEEVSDDETVQGEVFVTSSQVLFVVGGDSSKDFAIGAACIHLHAMMEEPEVSIYLQLTEGNDADTSPEVTLTPHESGSCQSLFDALCKLVALHPIADDDEGGEMGTPGFFEGDVMTRDDLIWAPAEGFGTVNGDEDEETGATEEERSAMLEKLDRLLVVKPEFEIHEGQFEDADEMEG